MKRLSLFFSVILCFFLSFNVNAQTKNDTDYFTGKWNVLVEGTPQGDVKMVFNLERKDGKLTGAVQDTTGKEISKIDKIDETEKSVTVYFTAQGYDVSLSLEKKDDDHVTGSLLGMFNAKGDRIKEEKMK